MANETDGEKRSDCPECGGDLYLHDIEAECLNFDLWWSPAGPPTLLIPVYELGAVAGVVTCRECDWEHEFPEDRIEGAS